MNKEELQGGARYVGGKIEEAVGDTVGSKSWKADGIIDQVAGSAEQMYGRAKSFVEDAIDGAPAVVGDARDKIGRVAGRAGEAARHGGQTANETLSRHPISWAVLAAAGGFAMGWLLSGRDQRIG